MPLLKVCHVLGSRDTHFISVKPVWKLHAAQPRHCHAEPPFLPSPGALSSRPPAELSRPYPAGRDNQYGLRSILRGPFLRCGSFCCRAVWRRAIGWQYSPKIGRNGMSPILPSCWRGWWWCRFTTPRRPAQIGYLLRHKAAGWPLLSRRAAVGDSPAAAWRICRNWRR